MRPYAAIRSPLGDMAMEQAGLLNTFLHIRGVGEKREFALWRRGISTWEDAVKRPGELKWLGKRKDVVRRASELSLRALEEGDAAFFSQRLPSHKRHRLLSEFSSETAYLDIETDPYRITLIGVFFRDQYHFFLRGHNLDQFYDFMREVKVVVTYNGSNFDLPILKRYFFDRTVWTRPVPGELFAPPQGVHLPGLGHIDLMSLCHKLGFKGGLKATEERLGIIRPESVRGMDGYDAVRLWNEYLAGMPSSLDLLIEYNRQDVINLKKILDLLRKEAGH